NAIKFSPAASQVSLELSMEGEQILIQLADTGKGIPAEQLPYIFDRFYQVKGETALAQPGTGIGLALVKELVSLHGGSIEVQSEVGQGTSFRLRIPRQAGMQEPSGHQKDRNPQTDYLPQLDPWMMASVGTPLTSTKPIGSHARKQEGHILIVEDHPDVRNFLKESLEGLGYQVSESVDGKSGLEAAIQLQPDLIISDVMMPKMNGLELAEAIRSNAKVSHTPLILLTARAEEEHRLEGLQTGIDAYLTKPFQVKELEIRVFHLIDQRRKLRQRFSEALVIRPAEVSAIPLDQQFLTLVTDTVEANMGEATFGVETLAAVANMSVTHLNRKLNALIGQSAGKLIRSMRLQRAAELLEQQAGNVAEIAYDIGFSDPTNFSRAFKKQFCVSPSRYPEE
ncbi:MAG: response regulator, partial [Bacteroidota bacterium]